MGNLGIFSSPVSNLDHLHDESIALNLIGKADSFTNSDSRSPLEQMANQLKDYEKVMDIDDPEQVAYLKNYKPLLEEMRRNVAAGKTSLEEINKYILDNELIQDIAGRTKELFDRRSLWLSITGTEELPSNFQQDRKAIEQDIKTAQNELNKSLKNASPEKIAALRSKQEAAIIYNQENISVVDINLSTDPTVAKTTSIFKASESREKNWSDEHSELKKRLENPSLTQEERQSLEQRIEKIDLALKFEYKIRNDEDFQDKIWSKLSKEQQKSILDDIKDDGELTEKSLQAITRATDRADETQTMSNGLFSLSRQAMMNMTGFTHEAYYEENKYSMNLVNNDFIRENIESGVYYSSSYDSSTYYSNVPQNNENGNSNTVQQRQAAIDQGLIEPASPTEKMLAEQHGLDPSRHKLLIFYLKEGDILNAYRYAEENEMPSLKESLQETMNKLAFQEVDVNPKTDEFFNLTFV